MTDTDGDRGGMPPEARGTGDRGRRRLARLVAGRPQRRAGAIAGAAAAGTPPPAPEGPDPAPRHGASTAPPPRARDELRRTALFLLKLALLVLVVRSLIVAPYVIPTESMLPRLWAGDYVLVAKWPYGWSRFSLPGRWPLPDGRIAAALPRRAEVVVFRAPPAAGHAAVKRVIGLPGDTVQLVAGQLVLNGVAVPRLRIADFTPPVTANSPCVASDGSAALRETETLADGSRICRQPRYRETLPSGARYATLDLARVRVDDTPVYTVPPGHLFVLGDNRDRSGDSRTTPADRGVGFVPLDHLEGRVLVTFLSVDGSGSLWRPWTWAQAIRWHRIGLRS